MGEVEIEIKEADDDRKVKKENKTLKNSSFPLHPSNGKTAVEQNFYKET